MKGVFNKFLFAAMLFALSAAATAQDIVVGQSAPLTGGNAAFGAGLRATRQRQSHGCRCTGGDEALA